MSDPTLPISARDLVPHRRSMLLISELSAFTPGEAYARLTVAAENPFVDARRRLDPVACAEMMAQTAAALRGCEARAGGETIGGGLLVGLSAMTWAGAIHAGEDLEVEVRRTLTAGKASLISGAVRRGGEEMAHGTLKLWEEETPSPLLAETRTAPPPPHTENRSPDRARLSPIHRGVLEALEGIDDPGRGEVAAAFLRFGEHFIGFDGHFDGRPILPGVVMLRAGVTIAERHLGRALDLLEAPRAKFSRPVQPSQRIRVGVGLSVEGDLIAAKVAVTGDEGQVAGFSFVASPGDRFTP